MLKTPITCLLVVAAANASAATYDPCLQAGAEIKEIADARDAGVMMSKFLISKAGRFDSDAEQERYFRVAVAIFLGPAASADALEEVAIDTCNAQF